ncbi:hypothetical protein [Xenorhabdus bovienii]|uniref:hypothetical protein n=1 Tax=Xenorhabdus bovienii TaxID=40576 RepID=UPI0023B33FB4|nr:hypothetical protein [Xenorhabdus bovienii]
MLNEHTINITALDYRTQSEFDINMILQILNEDDKGVKVGFQKDEDISVEKEKLMMHLTF